MRRKLGGCWNWIAQPVTTRKNTLAREVRWLWCSALQAVTAKVRALTQQSRRLWHRLWRAIGQYKERIGRACELADVLGKGAVLLLAIASGTVTDIIFASVAFIVAVGKFIRSLL
jgi:hypothetical protein